MRHAETTLFYSNIGLKPNLNIKDDHTLSAHYFSGRLLAKSFIYTCPSLNLPAQHLILFKFKVEDYKVSKTTHES